MEVPPTFAEEISTLDPDVHPGCLTFYLAAPPAEDKFSSTAKNRAAGANPLEEAIHFAGAVSIRFLPGGATKNSGPTVEQTICLPGEYRPNRMAVAFFGLATTMPRRTILRRTFERLPLPSHSDPEGIAQENLRGGGESLSRFL